MVEKHWQLPFDEAFKPPEDAQVKQGDSNVLRTLLYCDFMIPGADPQKYDGVSSLQKLLAIIEEYLGDYNAQVSWLSPMPKYSPGV